MGDDTDGQDVVVWDVGRWRIFRNRIRIRLTLEVYFARAGVAALPRRRGADYRPASRNSACLNPSDRVPLRSKGLAANSFGGRLNVAKGRFAWCWSGHCVGAKWRMNIQRQKRMSTAIYGELREGVGEMKRRNSPSNQRKGEGSCSKMQQCARVRYQFWRRKFERSGEKQATPAVPIARNCMEN
jgi:hypothetical protein